MHFRWFPVCGQKLLPHALILLFLGLFSALALAEPLTLKTAQISNGRISPGISVQQAPWQNISLDDAWRRQNPCRHGEWTYLLELPLSRAPDDDLGLLIHRGGNRLQFWLNNVRVGQFGTLDQPDADYSNGPHYVRLPRQAFQSGSNQLLIQVAGDCRRYAGLSQMELGPHEVVQKQWQAADQQLTRQTIGIISICSTLSLISLGLSLWRRDKQAFQFSAIAAFWALRTGLWSMNELPFRYELWFFLIDFSFAVWIFLVTVVAMDICNVTHRGLKYLQWLGMASFCLLSLASALGAPIFLKGMGLDIIILTAAIGLSSVWYMALRQPKADRLAIGIGGFLMLGVGLVDHWNVWFSHADDAYHRYYLTPLIVMFYILAIGAVLAYRFDQALRKEAGYRQSLEVEVERQRSALEARHAEAQAFLRHEVTEQERARIVREMHDGLGNHLIKILDQVKQGKVSPDGLENEIQDALDQLRYTMDTLSVEGDDPSTLLAQFRFRNESRFKRAGIQLLWGVKPLPEEAWPRADLLALERILREVFTNILKHAHALQIQVQAGHRDGVSHIAIADDGIGYLYPNTPSPGRKLLTELSHQLGIDLTIDSQPERGTVVTLLWKSPIRPRINE